MGFDNGIQINFFKNLLKNYILILLLIKFTLKEVIGIIAGGKLIFYD